jgi:hypothetical protein
MDLEATMRDARIAIIPGTLKTLINLDSPALWATIGVAANQATNITNIPLEWSALGVGILGAIEISSYLVDRRNEQRATLRESPFAYLFLAKHKKIIS